MLEDIYLANILANAWVHSPWTGCRPSLGCRRYPNGLFAIRGSTSRVRCRPTRSPGSTLTEGSSTSITWTVPPLGPDLRSDSIRQSSTGTKTRRTMSPYKGNSWTGGINRYGGQWLVAGVVTFITTTTTRSRAHRRQQPPTTISCRRQTLLTVRVCQHRPLRHQRLNRRWPIVSCRVPVRQQRRPPLQLLVQALPPRPRRRVFPLSHVWY